jgi:hypothetical protein
MIDVTSLDKIFVDDVMYLFDQGENISRIAYIMGCESSLIDSIICGDISQQTMEIL